MKFSQTLIASAVLLATSSVALAATDTRSIQINVTQGEFVTLVGTALTSINTFTSDQMDGNPIALGDLGLDSNLAGNCTIAFSSATGYKLNLGGAAAGATLVDYALNYDGAAVTATPATKTCQFAAAALSFNSTTPLPAANTIAAGTYSDVVSIVVTSI
jgi:hypothetical protein